MCKEDLTEKESREAVRMVNHFDFLRDTCATVIRASLVYWGVYLFVSAIMKNLASNYSVVTALLGYTLTTLKELRDSGKLWRFSKKEYGQVILFSTGFLLYHALLTAGLIVLAKWVS